MIPRPPGPTLFPYTTLFRSHQAPAGHEQDHSAAHRDRRVDDAAAGGVGFRVALPAAPAPDRGRDGGDAEDRKSTRLNSSHGYISYAVFCLKKKKQYSNTNRR